MYHDVTGKLALTTASTAVIEYSRAVSMGNLNGAGFEFWLLSASGQIDDVTVKLQGSNDLSNWTDVSGGQIALTNVDAPTHQSLPDAGLLPWSYVRLQYSMRDGGNYQVMLRAGIELFIKS